MSNFPLYSRFITDSLFSSSTMSLVLANSQNHAFISSGVTPSSCATSSHTDMAILRTSPNSDSSKSVSGPWTSASLTTFIMLSLSKRCFCAYIRSILATTIRTMSNFSTFEYFTAWRLRTSPNISVTQRQPMRKLDINCFPILHLFLG